MVNFSYTLMVSDLNEGESNDNEFTGRRDLEVLASIGWWVGVHFFLCQFEHVEREP